MKRKLISQLLQDSDSDARLRQLLPLEDGNGHDAARLILAAILKAASGHGITEPREFYSLVCDSTVEEIAAFLGKAPAAHLSNAKIARAQAILHMLLTSKAGRPSSSNFSRSEQLAEAQNRRRRNLRIEEGRVRIDEWVSEDAAKYLNSIKDIYGITKAEALNMVLLAASKGEALPPPSST